MKGDRELRKHIQDWNNCKIGQHMMQHEIQWHFTPPCASHMAGVWERMIRSTHTILKALVVKELKI